MELILKSVLQKSSKAKFGKVSVSVFAMSLCSGMHAMWGEGYKKVVRILLPDFKVFKQEYSAKIQKSNACVFRDARNVGRRQQKGCPNSFVGFLE